MTIRYLNCASMSPWFPRWQIGGTCLLVESADGLVLVDSGLGLHDFSNPTRMVRFFRWDFGIRDQPDSAAVRQVARLGYSPADVRHIVLTHLHFDHAGGLPDFPQVQVHVHQRGMKPCSPRTWIELAYDRADFAHQPAWTLYDQLDADWLGFEAIRLPFSVEMYFVPLFGHTRGHCGVAIRDQAGWLFQCADALPTNAQFDITPQWLNRLVLGPHVPRLQAWAKTHPDVQLLAGHMWQSYFELDHPVPFFRIRSCFKNEIFCTVPGDFCHKYPVLLFLIISPINVNPVLIKTGIQI